MLKSGSSTAFRRVAVIAAALSLALVACGGGDDSSSSDAENSRSGTTLTQVSPLTGLDAPDGFPNHPVIVVKIDNTSSAEPQLGLRDADMVVEELVEGGSTRLAAFFWTKTPNTVGPVRSMRASDVGIVTPANAVIVASGGAPKTDKVIKQAHIQTYTEATAPGFSRDSGRAAPYNLMMDLEKLAGTLKPAEAPNPYMPFGGPDDFSGTKPAGTVHVQFSGAHTTVWHFEKGTGWIRENGLAQQGDDFVPDNLLTLQVRLGNAGYLDPAGNPVPETKFYGKGSGVLFHDGKALPCKWSKDGASAELQLTTKQGQPVSVPAGHTWIELVPKRGGKVTYGR
jgi:Protein of unknown function (DUF3048) N-terminal domain/Protein of unknown function (DUF3048) C-terminal domain